MPSPFPGMDPYLEDDLWSTVHAQMVAQIARQLAPKLRPKYVALMGGRFVTGTFELGAGVAPLSGKMPLHTVEIRDVAKRRLVTAIEVLSPVNKRGQGRRAYLRRRRRFLLDKTHLMEIDLLRAGRRVPMIGELPPQPYFVFLSRTQRRPQTDIWPIALNQPLPTVPVPLLRPDPDVPLDLQQAFNTVYDLGSYDLLLDYKHPPELPLGATEATWAREKLAIPRGA